MKNFVLKNGSKVLLRSIKLEDYILRHQFFCELSKDQVGMIHSPHEIDPDPAESYEEIQGFLNKKRGLWLVAILNDEIIGEIDIQVKAWQKCRHVGSLSMGVSPRFQGIGLGRLLLFEAIKWSKVQGLSRIELFTFASNLKAQNLYKSFSFVVEGMRKNYLKHPDGSFENDLLMALILG